MQGKLLFIAESSERACVLDVESDKPGNITRGHGFSGTTYGDFIAGSNALKPVMALAAARGFESGWGKIFLRDIRVGELMKDGVGRVRDSHRGGNTHLGIIMLFVPISAAAGMCLGQSLGFEQIKSNLKRVVEKSTVDDALNLFDAINISEPGGLGESELDVRREESKRRIVDEGFTFRDIMALSKDRDRISSELSGGMPVVFDVGVPLLKNIYGRVGDINKAIIQTYLVVLSRYPDTLIARKVGLEKAEWVSRWARSVLDSGGVLTEEGLKKISEFDGLLRSDGNRLNPGTTADLIAASLFICLLQGMNV